MPSTLQCERARLQFHQVNFERMAAELDDQYNKRKMPDATNGLGWLSDVGQLNNIRLALQSFWMEALLRDERDKRIGGFGFVIENVLVDDPLPSDELRKAFDRVLASNRLREAAENEGEAEKIRAEKKAQAEKIALELRGQALVAFRRTIAEGNADAINAFVKETQLSPESALHFITSINEVESLSTAASAGAKVVFITAAAGRTGDTAKTQALLERT